MSKDVKHKLLVNLVNKELNEKCGIFNASIVLTAFENLGHWDEHNLTKHSLPHYELYSNNQTGWIRWSQCTECGLMVNKRIEHYTDCDCPHSEDIQKKLRQKLKGLHP